MLFEPFELRELKQIRKNLGLSQSELAKLAGVSQSLIAKIESNRLDPAYSKVKQIVQAITNLKKGKEITAKDIMHRRVIGVEREDDVRKAIELMKKHEISQLPVFEGTHPVGVVTETAILDCLMKKRGDYRVEEVMLDTPPIVSKNSSIDVISNLLKYFPIVLVSEDGNVVGVITKSDFIRKIAK
jgi:predicted transcriptional regulator